MSEDKKQAKDTGGVIERLCVKGWDKHKGDREFPYALEKHAEALRFAENWCRNGGEQTRIVRERSADGLRWQEMSSEPVNVPRFQFLDAE